MVGSPKTKILLSWLVPGFLLHGLGSISIAHSEPKPCVKPAVAETVIAKPELFPQALPVGLTEGELELLRNHPISKFAAEYQDKPVVFESIYFGRQMGLQKGEWVQAQYLRQILEKLFPKAVFVTGAEGEVAKVPKGAKKFLFSLQDRSEETLPTAELRKIMASGEFVPMHLVKPLASRQTINASKAEIRKNLGIAPDKKVLNLYIRAPDTLMDYSYRGAYPYSEYNQLLSKIAEAFPFDVVILSFGNLLKTHHRPHYDLAHHGKSFVSNVEELKGLLESPKEIAPKTLIFNDTSGKMPYLYRASDLTVVVGPVNFFEPISAGSRTVLLKKIHSVSRHSDYGFYNRDILEELVQNAGKAGGFQGVADYPDLPAAITQVLQGPAGSMEEVARATFPSVLDSLERHLRYLEKKPKGRTKAVK